MMISECKRRLKRLLLLSVVSSFFSLLAFVLNRYYEWSVGIRQPAVQTVLTLLFQWMGYFVLALLYLVIPIVIRYVVYARPLSGRQALLASFVNYATIDMILAMPYQLLTGQVTSAISLFVASCAASITAAAFNIAACHVMLMIPDDGDIDAIVSLDDYTICVSELGNFINLTKAGSRKTFPVENLWRPVLEYLKRGRTIKNAIREKGAHHDEIVLNAVGSMAFRLLSSGEYNVSPGVLSKEGEYLREIWKLAANELVRRRYNTPDDMARGLTALYSLTAQSPWREV
ncbi:MAG: hypothetical protein LBI74_08305 [Synergistaceae bacterium]|jgi:hypothetical protein|nr:hypothetical protein [Synergistaceae bacterium]